MSGRVTKPKGGGMLRRDFDVAVQRWTWLFEATDLAVDAWINRPRIGDVRPGGVAVFKPRDHFRSDGVAKKQRTRAEARAWCEANGGFRYYQCSVCQAWHVGHKPSARPAAVPTGLTRLAS